MLIDERTQQIQAEAIARIEQIRLLGEIELTDAERLRYRELVRDLLRFGKDATLLAPEVVALLVVDVARRRSDGLVLWPFVIDELVPQAASVGVSNQAWRARFAETFEDVVRRRQLPTFDHLHVEDGAMRFRTPILAHCLVPDSLAGAYLDKVIRLALERGLDAADAQLWLASNPPAGLPIAVQRFIIHGGDVARDLVDRTIDYARTRAAGQPDSGSGLPLFLRLQVQDWILGSDRGGPTAVIQKPRSPRPYLRYSYDRGEVVLELPYIDERGSAQWNVSGDPHLPGITAEASAPAWARQAANQSICIDRPFHSLRASLVDASGATVDSWPMPAVSASRPALFFHATTGRALAPGEFLDGTSWFILAPRAATISSDGRLECTDRPGSPLGWGGYDFGLWSATGASTLTLDVDRTEATWILRAEESTARFERSAPPSPHFESIDADLLATEGALPTVRIPARHGRSAADRSQLKAWQLTASAAGEPPVARSPEELNATFDEESGEWIVPLEELIPGADVGTWNIGVRGPLGQGASARLALLPARLEILDFPSEPRFVGTTRVVRVATDSHLAVIEAADRATSAESLWDLHDRNRNGRIPFIVRDARTGRETRALLRLPTVEWQWVSAAGDPSAWNEKAVFSPDDLSGAAVLRVRSNVPVRFEVHCVGADDTPHVIALDGGRQLRGGEFRLKDFSTTIQSAPEPIHYFELKIRERWPDAPVSARVGAVARPIPVTNLAAVPLDDGDLCFRWRQEGSASQVTASLSMRWRPWEEPAEADVEGSPDRTARFAVPPNLCGPAFFEVKAIDDWVGETTLSRRRLTLSPDLKHTYLRGLGTGPEALIERSLALCAGESKAPDLDALATELKNPRVLQRTLRLLTNVAERGSTVEFNGLAWGAVADALAYAEFDPSAFLEAVADSQDKAHLEGFLTALGVPRWRALWRHRAGVSEPLRRKLWSRWRPLGAIFDLNDTESEAAARRTRDHLGELAMDFGTQLAFRAAAGHVATRTFLPTVAAVESWKGHIDSTPQPLLAASEFAARCASDLQGIIDRGGDAAGAVIVQRNAFLLREMAANTGGLRAVGWDAVGSRLAPGMSGFELLPWASLVVAMWERRVGRCAVANSAIAEGSRIVGMAIALARIMPRTFERDLCLAEAILSRRIRRAS